MNENNTHLIDPVNLATYVKMSKIPDEMIVKIPFYVQNIIVSNDLINIDDQDERARIFLQELYVIKKSQTIVQRHFNVVKSFLFPDTVIRPNLAVFDISTRQVRTPDMNDIESLVNYCVQNINTNTQVLPILMAYYTALRISEIIALTTFHLIQLREREPVLKLNRKNNSEWIVVYYDAFNEYVDFLLYHFRDSISLYETYGIESRLFDYTQRTVGEHLNKIYRHVLHKLPPYGFGIHVFRYYMATKLANNGKKELARIMLGHVNIRTTERYIKSDNKLLEQQLNLINKNAKLYREMLNVDCNAENVRSETVLGSA